MGIFTIHMGGVLGRRKYFNEISREKYMAYAIFFLFSLSSSKSYFSDILCSVLCSNRHVFFSLKAFLCISLFFTQNLPKCSLSYQFPVLTTCQGSGLWPLEHLEIQNWNLLVFLFLFFFRWSQISSAVDSGCYHFKCLHCKWCCKSIWNIPKVDPWATKTFLKLIFIFFNLSEMRVHSSHGASVAQANIKLLGSSDSPILAFQRGGITGMSHRVSPQRLKFFLSDNLKKVYQILKNEEYWTICEKAQH